MATICYVQLQLCTETILPICKFLEKENVISFQEDVISLILVHFSKSR